MEKCICNRCFASVNRGKKPFHLTDCGHVYCQRCVEQARDKCPQCNMTGVRSLVLEKPMLPEIACFFAPTSDVLLKLQRTVAFQTEQVNILVHRFVELDAIYQGLKLEYVKLAQERKRVNEANEKLKLESEKLERRFMALRLRNGRTTTNLTMPNILASKRSWFGPNKHSNTSENTGVSIAPTQRFNADNDHTKFVFRKPHYKLPRPSDFLRGYTSDGPAIVKRQI